MSKQAMQKALDALDKSNECIQAMTDGPGHAAWGDQLDANERTIEELRAALDAPVEPVASVVRNGFAVDGRSFADYRFIAELGKDCPEALYTTPPDTEGLRKESEDTKKDLDMVLLELERVKEDAARYQSLTRHQYPQLAAMFGVTFGSFTPADDIIRRIGLNIDAQGGDK
jgi:hypothetical protein